MDMVITDIQALALIVCAALSLVAYKVKVPSIALIPAVGFFVLGFEIYNASEDLLILALFFMTAVVQFVLCFGQGSRS